MSGPFVPPAPPPSPPPGPTPTPYRAWDGWGLHPALWTLMRLQWRGRWRGTPDGLFMPRPKRRGLESDERRPAPLCRVKVRQG